MTSHPNSIRVMLRLNLNDPRMAKARDILEEGVRQERYKSKSHMIVDAVLRTFDGEAVPAPPTMDAIRAALREEMRMVRLTALTPNDVLWKKLCILQNRCTKSWRRSSARWLVPRPQRRGRRTLTTIYRLTLRRKTSK